MGRRRSWPSLWVLIIVGRLVLDVGTPLLPGAFQFAGDQNAESRVARAQRAPAPAAARPLAPSRSPGPGDWPASIAIPLPPPTTTSLRRDGVVHRPTPVVVTEAAMSTVDVFILGYCEDTRVLLELLLVEAPALLPHLVIVEPDDATARDLAGRGFHVRQASLTDPERFTPPVPSTTLTTARRER
jgi:hypothetical protein